MLTSHIQAFLHGCFILSNSQEIENTIEHFCSQICHDTVNCFCAIGTMLIYRQLVEKLLWLNRLSSLYHWLSTQQFLRRQTLVRSLPPNCQDSQINGTAVTPNHHDCYFTFMKAFCCLLATYFKTATAFFAKKGNNKKHREASSKHLYLLLYWTALQRIQW